MFNTSEQIECSDFVYATDEKNVQTEVKFTIKFFNFKFMLWINHFS